MQLPGKNYCAILVDMIRLQSVELITLENIAEQKLIQDLVVRPLKVNKDESGILVETLRKDWVDVYGEKRDFSMQYYSITPPGLARDEDVWHCHPVQEDRMLVVSGAIVLAVADKRKDSSTKDSINLFHMDSEKPYMVLVPANTLHGFMVVSKDKATLLNFPTALYNPNEEGRVPYSQANVVLEDGTPFSWGKVREKFASTSYDEK